MRNPDDSRRKKVQQGLTTKLSQFLAQRSFTTQNSEKNQLTDNSVGSSSGFFDRTMHKLSLRSKTYHNEKRVPYFAPPKPSNFGEVTDLGTGNDEDDWLNASGKNSIMKKFSLNTNGRNSEIMEQVREEYLNNDAADFNVLVGLPTPNFREQEKSYREKKVIEKKFKQAEEQKMQSYHSDSNNKKDRYDLEHINLKEKKGCGCVVM